MFGFGKKKTAAEQDLLSGRWRCSQCDAEHGWPMDLAAPAPDPWPHGDDYEANGALRLEGDFLSEDFCVLGGRYFMIRGVLPIPVIGLPGHFGFGCWTTLSRENFDRYVDAFDGHAGAELGQMTGWLMNQLSPLMEDTDPLALWVEPRSDRQRPLLWVQDETHPLAIAQESGIGAEQMVEIFRRYGHGP